MLLNYFHAQRGGFDCHEFINIKLLVEKFYCFDSCLWYWIGVVGRIDWIGPVESRWVLVAGPGGTVKASVLDCFGDMIGLNFIIVVEVGDGACDF